MAAYGRDQTSHVWLHENFPLETAPSSHDTKSDFQDKAPLIHRIPKWPRGPLQLHHSLTASVFTFLLDLVLVLMALLFLGT